MPHCEICDFCETTNTPSNYYTEHEQVNNVVRYRKNLEQFLCNECVTAMQYNKLIFQDTELEQEIDLIDRDDLPIKHRTVDEDTLTLSEL